MFQHVQMDCTGRIVPVNARVKTTHFATRQPELVSAVSARQGTAANVNVSRENSAQIVLTPATARTVLFAAAPPAVVSVFPVGTDSSVKSVSHPGHQVGVASCLRQFDELGE